MMPLTFRGDAPEKSLARLIKAEGLDAGSADVQTEAYAMMDGSALTGARMGARQVRLIYALTGDRRQARKRIYEVFEPKSSGTLWLAVGDRRMQAEAVVGAVEADPFDKKAVMEVALTLPDPWLYNDEEDVYAAGAGGWEFPNRGASVGIVAQVGRAGYVELDGQRIAWDASAELASTAVLTLDTREGHRGLFLDSGGTRTGYSHALTAWGWSEVPHGSKVQISSDAPKGNVTIRERWAGI